MSIRIREISVFFVACVVAMGLGERSSRAQEGASGREPDTVEAPPEGVSESAAEPDDPFHLDPIFVTGARTAERASESPVATQVLTRADLVATGAENVAEALEELSGLEVVPDVGGQVVRVRGLDPQQTLILVDGDRVIGRIDGGIDLTRISIEEIERIEIVRSGSSALYGSEAAGGVIHIITRDTVARRQLAVHSVLGWLGTPESYGFSGDASVVAGFRRRRGGLTVTGGIHRMPSFRRDPSTPSTTSSEQLELNYEARGTYVMRPGHRFVARSRSMIRNIEAVDASATSAVFDRRNRTEEHVVSLGTDHDFDERGELELRATFTYFRDQFASDQRQGPMDRLEDAREQLVELRARHTYEPGSRHRLVAGADTLIERLDTPRLSQVGVRGRVSPFAEYRLRVRAGESVVFTVVPGVRADLDTQFGAYVSPKLASRLDLPGNLALRGSVGRGFRAPNFRESYLFFENPAVGYRVVGNPDLDVETSLGTELGVEWRASRRLTATVTFFRTELRGMITTATDGTDPTGSTFTYVNVDRARNQGLESALSARPLPWLKLDLGYVFLHARNLETGRWIEGRPRHRATFKAEIEAPRTETRLVVRGAWNARRPYYDVLGALDAASAWTSLDVRVSQPIGERVQVFVGGDNLLDAGGARLPIRPRGVYLGLDADLGSAPRAR